MTLDKVTMVIAIMAGMLCAAAGIWQSLFGNMIFGGLFDVVAWIIAGWVWHHLIQVHRDRQGRD